MVKYIEELPNVQNPAGALAHEQDHWVLNGLQKAQGDAEVDQEPKRSWKL